MQFNNDCSLCSVAMVLRVPYRRVLKAALARKFKPNGRFGADVYSLLIELEYDCEHRVYTGGKWDHENRVWRRNIFARRPIPVKGPWIVSIPSLNNRGGFHAVVVHNGKVYDPSNLRRADINYVMRNRRHIYYGFTHD